MSWVNLLPTALPRQKKPHLDNASRYTFPNLKMQFLKVNPIRTYSFEPSPNHSSAASILSTKQHHAYSYSPQGYGKLPNKGNNTAHGKTMPSRCWDIISDEKSYGPQRSFHHSLSRFNPSDGTNIILWKGSALLFVFGVNMPYYILKKRLPFKDKNTWEARLPLF